jgi:hypothetical protein
MIKAFKNVWVETKELFYFEWIISIGLFLGSMLTIGVLQEHPHVLQGINVTLFSLVIMLGYNLLAIIVNIGGDSLFKIIGCLIKKRRNNNAQEI